MRTRHTSKAHDAESGFVIESLLLFVAIIVVIIAGITVFHHEEHSKAARMTNQLINQ